MRVRKKNLFEGTLSRKKGYNTRKKNPWIPYKYPFEGIHTRDTRIPYFAKKKRRMRNKIIASIPLKGYIPRRNMCPFEGRLVPTAKGIRIPNYTKYSSYRLLCFNSKKRIRIPCAYPLYGKILYPKDKWIKGVSLYVQGKGHYLVKEGTRDFFILLSLGILASHEKGY